MLYAGFNCRICGEPVFFGQKELIYPCGHKKLVMEMLEVEKEAETRNKKERPFWKVW